MTVTELAQNLGVTPEKLFEFFEHIQRSIPHELDFELSEDLIKSAEENKLAFEAKNSNKEKVNIEEVVQELDDKELNKLLAQSSQEMIKDRKSVV